MRSLYLLFLIITITSCGRSGFESVSSVPNPGVYDAVATTYGETCGSNPAKSQDFVVSIEQADEVYTLFLFSPDETYKEAMALSIDGYLFYGGRFARFDGCSASVGWEWEISYTRNGILGSRINIFFIECDLPECVEVWGIKGVIR